MSSQRIITPDSSHLQKHHNSFLFLISGYWDVEGPASSANITAAMWPHASPSPAIQSQCAHKTTCLLNSNPWFERGCCQLLGMPYTCKYQELCRLGCNGSNLHVINPPISNKTVAIHTFVGLELVFCVGTWCGDKIVVDVRVF